MKLKTRKRLGWLLLIPTLFAIFWAPSIQLPYVISKPGPAFNVLGFDHGTKLVQTEPAAADNPGSIDLLTISVYGSPGSTPELRDLVTAFFSQDQAIYPLDVFYPVGTSSKKVEKEEQQAFDEGQVNALAAVANELAPKPVDLTKIKLTLANVGGPSGGLAWALGVLDNLSAQSLTGGKRIAVTGTISKNGVVGEIGGIRQKIYGAQIAGDKFLFLPKANCPEALSVTDLKLQLIPVGTLHEALDYLKIVASDGNLKKVPSCSRLD